jgi:imidazolonepropionase-like amidohydrolase
MANSTLSQSRHKHPARWMRRAGVFIALAAIALMLVNMPTVRLDSPTVTAIKDAQIVVSAGKTIAKGSVVIRNGLITEVGENIKIPADARVIDGTGLIIYPGFIDGFTSLGLPGAPAPAPAPGGGNRQAAIAAAAATPQQNPEAAVGDPSNEAAEQVRPGGAALEDARNAGVTTALTTPRSGIFAGQSALINLDAQEASKLVVRAPVGLTVQFSTGRGFGGGYPASLMGTVSYIRQTFYDAIRYRDEVERYHKIKRGVSRPHNDKRLAALQPALRGDLPVVFLANTDNDIRRALMVAEEFKLKPIIAGALYGYRLANTLKAKNIPVILSVDFPARASDWPDDEEESLRILQIRAETPRGAAVLAQAGVKFAFTSGSLRPADFLANIRRAVENGLSKDEALRALTVNAAELFGVSEQLGTIETGKIANLVVMSGDLWAKDSKIRHVFIDGNQIELKKETPAQPQRPGGRGTPGGQIGEGPNRSSAAVDASGDWTLLVKSPQGDLNVRLTLRREGGSYSGTLSSSMGDAPLRDISVTGNQLRAMATLNISGQTMDATVNGTIEGDSIRGTISLPQMGAFDFTGSKPK